MTRSLDWLFICSRMDDQYTSGQYKGTWSKRAIHGEPGCGRIWSSSVEPRRSAPGRNGQSNARPRNAQDWNVDGQLDTKGSRLCGQTRGHWPLVVVIQRDLGFDDKTSMIFVASILRPPQSQCSFCDLYMRPAPIGNAGARRSRLAASR